MKRLLVLLLISLTLLAFVACQKASGQEGLAQIEDSRVEVEAGDPDNQVDYKEEHGIKIYKDQVSFVDDRGEEVSLKRKPERVVVIYNSFLELWMESGGSVIGVIEASIGQDPIEGIEEAELVGKLGSISLEKIIDLEPDLVILNSKMPSQIELVASLEENGIPLVALDNSAREDYYKMARLFSALTGREDLYERNVLELGERLDEIVEKSPKDKNYKVLLVMASAKSVTARGSDTTVGEILQDLNTINIADDSGNLLSNTNFSIEKIIEEDPDFIFVQTTGSDMEGVMDRLREDVENNPAWSSLSAVENQRYIILPKDLYMFKPNNKYDQAYLGLAEILYPEIFN